MQFSIYSSEKPTVPVIQLYKTKSLLNLLFMMGIFHQNSVPYQLGSMGNLNHQKMRTTYYCTDTVAFMGQRVWTKLPKEIKTFSSLAVFSKRYRQCNCRICKTFSYVVGYFCFLSSYLFHLFAFCKRLA